MGITLNAGKLKNFKGVSRFRGALLKELQEATKDAVNAVQNKAKQEIAKGAPRSGRLRKAKKRKGRITRSSARGEYPKADTGTLGRSIMARVSGLNGQVGSHLKYAEILESDKLDRRHITRAAEEMEPFIQNLARQAIRNSARKARK